MRNISFSMTLDQFKNRTKFVTRRTGWLRLGRRTFLQAVEKAQGLKKGEQIQKIGIIHVSCVSREPLNAITKQEVILEGFPEMSVAEFIDFFTKSHKCQPNTLITRIEFGYLLDEGGILCATAVFDGEIKTKIIK